MDITICLNQECPLKSTCHRHEENRPFSVSDHQSMAIFGYENGKCDSYWRIQSHSSASSMSE